MHFRMLVTVSLPEGATSEEARSTVHDALMNDDSFCGSGGRFGAPISDWFVIGGRWSGLLAETTFGDAYKTAAAGQDGAKLDALWREHGGAGPSPINRDSYDELGYPDDAMPLTPELYASLLSAYEGHDMFGDWSHCEFVDLDFEALKPDFAGRKWLVVVDYHN